MKKVGNGTYMLENPVAIVNTASIVGPKEKRWTIKQIF